MYIPPHFEQPDIEVMHELIRNRPFATLVTLGSDGINANHIPLHLVTRTRTVWCVTTAMLPGQIQSGVTLNRMLIRWPFSTARTLISARLGMRPSRRQERLFPPGITLSFMPTVPFASSMMLPGFVARWRISPLITRRLFLCRGRVSDAPEDFTEKLIEAVIGIEMVITRLSGKWKVSQNQPPQNQASVIQGLNASGQSEAISMASLVNAGVKNVR